MTTPRFSFKKSVIENHLTGTSYNLRRMADLEATDDFIDSVVSVCNEPQVYDWLFRERLEGKPYPPSDAGWFKEWGTQGWEDNTHYLFIVTDDKGRAAAACDIKSADLDAAEIGYWASGHHRGVMTNAVKAMVAAGFEAGFRRFYARVKPGNDASAAVLKRSGFIPTEEFTDGGFLAFELRKS